MAVTHFERDGKHICSTRVQKNPLLVTEDPNEVTCKMCLKILAAEEAEEVEDLEVEEDDEDDYLEEEDDLDEDE